MSRISDWVEKTKGGSDSVDIDGDVDVVEAENVVQEQVEDLPGSAPEEHGAESVQTRSFGPQEWRDLHLGAGGVAGSSGTAGGDLNSNSNSENFCPAFFTLNSCMKKIQEALQLI